MEFTKVISSPVFAGAAPDIGLSAQDSSPVTLKVSYSGTSWEIMLTPSQNGTGEHFVTIRLRDILRSVVEAPLPGADTEDGIHAIALRAIPTVNLSASNEAGEQASMDIPVAYGNLTGRTPEDFAGQWLTSREQICRTYPGARERLSLIFGQQLLGWTGTVNVSVHCKVYFLSGTPEVITLGTSASAGNCYYSVDCSYDTVTAHISSDGLPAAWDVYYTLEGTDADGEVASLESFPQRFVLASQDVRVKEFLFTNCFGMEDRVFGEGISRRKVDGTSSTFVNGGKTLEVSNNAETVYEVFSGQLPDRRSVFHWHDFLSSAARMLYSNGSTVRIVVDSSDSETEDFAVGGVNFSYHLSTRHSDFPGGLCGTLGDFDPQQQFGALWVDKDPDAVTPSEEDLFFLKHRLSEFPALNASDALLLLVQSPATDAWGSISLGNLKSWIEKSVDGKRKEIRLNALADYKTADGLVIDPNILQDGSIPVWNAAAGTYVPATVADLGMPGGLGKDEIWQMLSAETKEQINVSHLSASAVAELLTKAGYKLTDTTYALATDTVAGLVKTGYPETEKNYALKLDTNGRAYVSVPWTDSFEKYFGVDADGNLYVKDGRGFYSNSFISARGADPEAGGGGGLDVSAMWAALAAGTSEQINASHIPALSISKITGLQDALDSKLSAITRDMVESVLTGTVTSHNHDGMYAPLSGGVVPSQYLPSYVDDVLEYASKSSFPASGEAGKIYVALDTNLTYRWGGSSYVEISPSLALGYTSSTAYPGNEGAANASAIATLQGYFTGGAANKVAHALTISYDGGTAVKFDGSSALSVTIPSDEQRALWDKICALFDIDEDGNVYVTNNRGFYSNSFLSARGADPEAGQGGTGGIDEDELWTILATSGTQKIDASHIPALGLLSGTVSNAQLANSSITIAGVEVPLGSAVTTAQIASALTAAGYKLTDTVTTLASMGITATAAELNRLDGITASTAELNCLDGISGPIQKQIDAKADASALAGYLPLTGGTVSGNIMAATAAYFVTRMNTDTSNFKRGLAWANLSNDNIASISYWNTEKRIYLNPIENELDNLYNDAVGKYNLIVGKNQLTYNTYPLLHSGNYTSYTVTKTGGGASGTWPISISGDAATLGGYGPGTLTRLIDYYNSGVLSAVGWYRVFTATDSNARGITVMLYLWRSYSQTNNEAYIFNISIAYNGRISITQTSGGYNARLIDKIRVVWVNSGACYIDFHIGISSQGNRYYVSGKGVGTFQAPAAVSETVTGNVTEFSTVNGVASNYGFTGDLSGTASNASMLDGWFSAVNTWYPSSTISLNDYTNHNALSSVGWDYARSKYVAGGPYGDYFSCAATVLTLPGTYPPQLYSDYNGNRYFLRTFQPSQGWSTWKEIVTSSRIGSMTAGDTTAFCGYGLASFDVTTDLGKCTDFGYYVIGLMQITDYTTAGNHADGRLIFIRQNGNNAPQQIVYSLGTRYNTTNVRFGFLRMSTAGVAHPCTFTYNGKKWAGFVVRYDSSYLSGVYCSRYAMRSGERSTPFMVKYYTSNTSTVNNAEINNSLLINGSDIELDGVSTNYFAGDLSGNASSATKLATARTLWGQLFNGENNVSGDMTGVGGISMSGGINSRVYVGSGDDLSKIGFSSHNVEFKGHGYLYMSYYFRPGYSSKGASNASVYIQNASASNSPTFTTTHAFYNTGNATHTGLLTVGSSVKVGLHTLMESSAGRFILNSTGAGFMATMETGNFCLCTHNTGSFGARLLEVDTSGRVGIKASPLSSYTITVAGTGYFSSALEVAGTIHSSTGIWSDGYVSAHGVDTTSDRKFKDDITQLDGRHAIAVIRALKPSIWTWNSFSKVKGRSAGFVAQEVMGILPEAIRETGKDKHLALNYQMLHAYEVAALQEHDGEIQRLRRRVAELENKIKDTWHTGQTS